jgi:phosphoserine phosphatase
MGTVAAQLSTPCRTTHRARAPSRRTPSRGRRPGGPHHGTNRFITELTAALLGIVHLLATECEVDRAGRFTGRTVGTLNMREGKVARLHEWLAEQCLELHECDSTLYSDSINDLPLLQAVRRPIAVNPDIRLAIEAADRGWQVLHLHKLL